MSDFYSEDPERYEIIEEAAVDFGIDIFPSSGTGGTQQAETFWRSLWEQCPWSTPDEKSQWIRDQLPKYFRSFDQRPNWLQNPDWPFAGGKPMVFVGQIDARHTPNNLAGNFFHDDVSFYVFIPSYDLIGSKEIHYPDELVL